MKNRTFPSWSGPLVGMVVGALCGVRAGFNAQIPIYFFILGGLRAACGMTVLISDYFEYYRLAAYLTRYTKQEITFHPNSNK